MQIAKCKSPDQQEPTEKTANHKATSVIFLCFLCSLLFSFPVKAGTPRDDLLRLVPEDVGFCLVIQDLRGHSESFLRSPFAKKLWESPTGTGVVAAASTYLIDGVQYVSVAVGWGGVFGIAVRATELQSPGMRH